MDDIKSSFMVVISRSPLSFLGSGLDAGVFSLEEPSYDLDVFIRSRHSFGRKFSCAFDLTHEIEELLARPVFSLQGIGNKTFDQGLATTNRSSPTILLDGNGSVEFLLNDSFYALGALRPTAWVTRASFPKAGMSGRPSEANVVIVVHPLRS
jgi:hypothetical protein